MLPEHLTGGVPEQFPGRQAPGGQAPFEIRGERREPGHGGVAVARYLRLHRHPVTNPHGHSGHAPRAWLRPDGGDGTTRA